MFPACGAMQIMFWKLNLALHLNTKCMLNKGLALFSRLQRLGHSLYPVTEPKNDTINSEVKPDSEFT